MYVSTCLGDVWAPTEIDDQIAVYLFSLISGIDDVLVQEHHQHAGWKISLYAKRWSHLPSISQAQGELWPAGTYIYELDHHFNITTP